MPALRCILLICVVELASASNWKPIDPQEMAQQSSKIEADADSEAIFWEVRVMDEVINSQPHTVLWHYLRIKIFNERGRNRWSAITIPIPEHTHVSDIEARTVHPDGTAVEIDKKAIHEQNVVKTGSTRVKQLSWPMPAVEPGSIIEYRFHEARENRYAHYVRLDFQLDIPIQVVRYWIKPYSAPNFRWQMYIADFQCPHTAEHQPDGYYLATLTNVRAFRREPRMPPDDHLRAWSLVYYRPVDRPGPEKYWNEYGKSVYNGIKDRTKVTKELQAKANEVTSAAKTEEEKLNALSDFCRMHIRRVQSEAVSAEEREDVEKNKTPVDTLGQGMGTDDDIRFLFVALASAAGFETHVAKLANRNHPAFNPGFVDPYFLRDTAVAVRTQRGWRFYDPTSTFVPHDMLPSQFEGAQGLVIDPKESIFVTIPASRPDQTIARHTGYFRLQEDGSLEGNLELQFTGHYSAIRKQYLSHNMDAQREEMLKNEIKQIASTAEISAIKIENASDPDKPILYQCHVRVPSYAERTGKRIFFAGDFFRQSQKPPFPEKDRRYPVYFPFAFTEEDVVTIEIPPTFEFDAPNIPPAIPIGDAGRYELKAQIQDGKRLVYTRRLTISKVGGMVIPVESYPVLKDIFDHIAAADQQTFALKQKSSPATESK
jgi:hypothetical protein